MSRIVVTGDALLDRDLRGDVSRLAPDAPVPVVDERETTARGGGAALAATMLALDGHDVTLVTALARDSAADELRGLLSDRGITVVDLGLRGATPEKIRVHAGRQPVVRLDRGGGGTVGPCPAEACRALAAADAVLVADYGRGVCAEPGVRTALTHAAEQRPVVWDPHPHGADPVPGTCCATPNAAEAARLATGGDAALGIAEAVLARWPVAAVCVTHGAHGAVLATTDAPPCIAPTTPAPDADPCGAGDRFASALTSALAGGARLSQAVVEAVEAATAFVAGRGLAALTGELPPWHSAPPHAAPHSLEHAVELAHRVRAAGGTVVATGGCFDLLHVGHARLLDGARRLGDTLIVLMNSDASVRLLKGTGRPVNSATDRAALLTALGAVEAVAVFDEPTPEAALRRLQPDVWVKGGEYEHRAIPEADVVREMDGRIALVPQFDGRSTTRLMEEIRWRSAR